MAYTTTDTQSTTLPTGGYFDPTSADQVSALPEIKLSTLAPSAGDPYSAAASSLGVAGGVSTGQEYLNSILPLVQSQYSTQEANKTSFFKNLVSPTSAKTSALDELKNLGIQPLETLKDIQSVSTEVAALKAEYDKLNVEKMNNLEAMRYSSGGTVGGVTDSMTAAERNANFKLNSLSVQINGKAAYLQALQGNYAQALTYVDKAVSDAKENNDFLYNQFQITESQNKNLFESITGVYKEAWNFAKQEADRQRQEKNSRLDRLYTLAGKVAESGNSTAFNSVMSILGRGNISDADVAEAYRQAGVSIGGQSPVDSGYQQERALRVLGSIDDLKGRVGYRTVGLIGSIGKYAPGSVQRDFKADLDNLKSNIAFSELQAMRAASKTGGALGQVAVRELELLESTLGALDQGQSPENFRKNLEKVRESLSRWDTAVAKTGGSTSSGYSAGDVVEYNGKQYRVGSDGDTLIPL
jgi:hypothetical protein